MVIRAAGTWGHICFITYIILSAGADFLLIYRWTQKTFKDLTNIFCFKCKYNPGIINSQASLFPLACYALYANNLRALFCLI